MCGIAGLVNPELSCAQVKVALCHMTDAIVHRGPDDQGAFAIDGVGLGMRRLSIIDLAGGHQPIANEDDSIWVVLNGEIYNYQQLRSDLIQRGHHFRTQSDTEVIVHLYEERGESVFSELRGMFAIAIWDQRASRLILARDRLGKKPLFYACEKDRLVFGSEIKALLAVDPGLSEPNRQAILPYFRFGFVPEPATMFERVFKLPAAHWLIYEQGTVSTGAYWQLRVGGVGAPARSIQDWQEELDARLLEAVRIRLMSDVPLGVFLSGGLDSSAVVAYAHKAGMRPLKTYTIGFDRAEWDESDDAQRVATWFQTDHHTLMLREEDMMRSLPSLLHTMVRHFDEPFGDASAIPTYYVSQLAREHVTVILSGDGGDELFAGYTAYQGLQFAERYRHVPAWLREQILPATAYGLARVLPIRHRYKALRMARILKDSSLPFVDLYFAKASLCNGALLRQIFRPEALEEFGAAAMLPRSVPQDILDVINSRLPLLSRTAYADYRFRLLDDMLVKVDRMSMANSLEVRSPLLDHELIEFVAQMPSELKLRNGQTKALLRDVLRRYLPAPTVRKRKQGFSVPLRDWFRDGLAGMVSDMLESTGHGLPQDEFNLPGIRRIVTEHKRGVADHSSAIWLLLNYVAWRSLYFGD